VIIVDLFSVKFLLPEPINKTDLGTGFFQIITIALVCIIGPVTEEVFFRGFVLTGFIHHFGISRSVALSSAVFAVCHIDPGVFVPFFLTGMLLSWLYINTGSIWPSVVAHMAQNMIATTAIFTLN
jgi:membrane protease YdiL (CAAX protease family)